jgi:hypothetical protein
MIRVVEQVGSDGAALGASVDAVFYDQPNGIFNPDAYELLLDDGSCRYFRSLPPPLCNPPCGASGMCNAKAECVPWPHRISAGPITITGLVEPVTLTPDATAYYSAPNSFLGDLFGASSTIKVSAAGGEVPAFTTTLVGVDPLVANIGDTYPLEDGHDNLLSWTAQGDGASVEVAIQTGWHGAPPSDIIWCVAPEAAGTVVIPQAMVEMYPPAGGIGLFPHLSTLKRVHRQLVEWPGGSISVAVASELWFSIVH